MASASPFSQIRLLPKAPVSYGDVTTIRGNCSDEHKQLNLNTLAFFAGDGDPAVFGYGAAKHLKLVEMCLNRKVVSSSGDARVEALEGHTVCEVEIGEGMLSKHGTAAGACLVHLLDIGTFTALYTIGFAIGIDPTGGSTSLDIRWHAAVLPGTVLSIHSTTLNYKGRTVSCRAEIYNKTRGTLVASATHTVTPLTSLKETATRKARL